MTGSPEQEPVHETETTIREKMVILNSKLAEMPEGEERDRAGYQYRDYLDEEWRGLSLMYVNCLVTGPGVYPKYLIPEGEESEVLEQPHPRELQICAGETSLEAESRGFAYLSVAPDEPKKLWYLFELSETVTMPHPVAVFTTELFAFFDERCKIIPVDNVLNPKAEDPLGPMTDEELFDGSEDVPNPEIQAAYVIEHLVKPKVKDDREIPKILSARSDRLLRLIRSTKFRQADHSRQIELVDGLISRAEDYAGIRELHTVMDSQYAFITEPSEASADGIEYHAIGLSNLMITGTCMALTMLGRERLTRVPIRDDSDLLTRYEGLAVTIELAEPVQTTEPERLLEKGTIIHVPISGQHVEALFARPVAVETFEDDEEEA